MNKHLTILFTVLSLLVMNLSPAYAHHSRAMFDFDSALDLTGTVAEWQFTNPHVFIILDVDNEDGSTTRWTLEGLGPNTVYRQGWNPDSLKPGDRIIVNVAPLFAGGSGGSYSNVRWEDGATVDPKTPRP